MIPGQNGQTMPKTTKKKTSAKSAKAKRPKIKGVEARRAEAKAETSHAGNGTLPPPQPAAPPPPPPPQPAAAQELAYRVGDPAEFGRNMARVAVRSRDLLSAFVRAQAARSGREPLDPLNVTGAYYSLFKDMAANPGRVLNAQVGFWKDYMTLVQRSAERAMGRTVEPVVTPAPTDRRFRDKDWQENQIFDFIKQSYLLAVNSLQKAVAAPNGKAANGHARAVFYARQFADAIAPTNFALTNPEVLARDAQEQRRESGARARQPPVRLEARPGQSQHSSDHGQFRDRPRYRDHARQGRIPERAVRADPIRAGDQDGLRNAAADLPAVDQQILHHGSAAEEFVRPLGGRARLHRVHGVVGQSR